MAAIPRTVQFLFKALMSLVEGDTERVSIPESVSEYWGVYTEGCRSKPKECVFPELVKSLHANGVKYTQITVNNLEMVDIKKAKDGDRAGGPSTSDVKCNATVTLVFIQDKRDYQLLVRLVDYHTWPPNPEFIAIQHNGWTTLGSVNNFYGIARSEIQQKFKMMLAEEGKPIKRIEKVAMFIHDILSTTDPVALQQIDGVEVFPPDILFRLTPSRLSAQASTESIDPENCSYLQSYLPWQQASETEHNFDRWRVDQLEFLIAGKEAARAAKQGERYRELFKRARVILEYLKVAKGGGRKHLNKVLDERASRAKVLILEGCYDLEHVTEKILELWASRPALIRDARLSFDDWNNLVNHPLQRREQGQRLAAIFRNLGYSSREFPLYGVVEYYLAGCPKAIKSGVAFLVHCTRQYETLIKMLRGGALLQSGPAAGHNIGTGADAFGYGIYFMVRTEEFIKDNRDKMVDVRSIGYGDFCLIVSPAIFDRKVGFRRDLEQKHGYPPNQNNLINNVSTNRQWIGPDNIGQRNYSIDNGAYAMVRDRVDLRKYLEEIWVNPGDVGRLREQLASEGLSQFAALVRATPSTPPTRQYRKGCITEE